MSCTQCQMLLINGLACHETGCTNGRRYKCFECGCDGLTKVQVSACCAPCEHYERDTEGVCIDCGEEKRI